MLYTASLPARGRGRGTIHGGRERLADRNGRCDRRPDAAQTQSSRPAGGAARIVAVLAARAVGRAGARGGGAGHRTRRRMERPRCLRWAGGRRAVDAGFGARRLNHLASARPSGAAEVEAPHAARQVTAAAAATAVARGASFIRPTVGIARSNRIGPYRARGVALHRRAATQRARRSAAKARITRST